MSFFIENTGACLSGVTATYGNSNVSIPNLDDKAPEGREKTCRVESAPAERRKGGVEGEEGAR